MESHSLHSLSRGAFGGRGFLLLHNLVHWRLQNIVDGPVDFVLRIRGRVWLDLGTSDGLAVDMLINALRCLKRDLVEISELRVGGMNEDWPAEAGDERFYEE